MRFPLGEMTVGDILDRGIKLLFARLPLFYLINLIVLAPVIALEVAQPFLMGSEVAIGKGGFDATPIFAGMGFTLLAILLTLILAPIGSAAILHVIMQTYVGKPTGLGESFGFALSRFVSLVLANLLVGLILMAGFFMCIIPGIFFMVTFAFVAQVVVLEKLGPSDGLSRSWSLTQGYRWRVLGVLLLVWVATLGVQIVVSLGINQFLPGQEIIQGKDGIRIIYNPVNQVVAVAVAQLVSILFTTYMAVCTTLLYLDLRIRKEGYDLELAAQGGEEAGTSKRRDDDSDRGDGYEDDRPRKRGQEPEEDPEEGLDPDRPYR